MSKLLELFKEDKPLASPAKKMDTADVVALMKNAALVAVAAGVTYLGENLSDLDLGQWGVMLVPIIAVGLDSVIKWAKDNTGK